MSVKTAKVWCCDICDWQWGIVTEGAEPPRRCANPECRSRRWNASAGENIPDSLKMRTVAAGLIHRAAVRRARSEEREAAALLLRR
jgi:hypothetical protein